MNKRKIILTAMIGAVALTTLSVSLTMAWYASSDRLKISSFDIDLNGDVQLLMSTSKELESFKEKLTKKDLVENEFLFAPVSSMYQDTWYGKEGKKDLPLFYDASSPALDGVVTQERATSGFFQKKIYLMSNLVNYYAALDVEKCSFKSDETANRSHAQELHTQYSQLSVDEITQKLNNLESCLRMSILVNTEDTYEYYVIDPNKEENKTVYFGGALDNDGDGYYDIYTDDQGNKKEVVYGDIEDRSKLAYNAPVNPDGRVELIENKGHFFGNSFEAQSRIDSYTFDKDNSSESKIVTEKSYTLEEVGDENNGILIPCYSGKPTEVVISIYLEGWDKACINNTMGACFDTEVTFKLLRRITK